jgi:hypothetical protein
VEQEEILEPVMVEVVFQIQIPVVVAVVAVVEVQFDLLLLEILLLKF